MERVILTTGGTGGHIFPALAVAEEIRARYPKAMILFMGGKQGQEADLAVNAGLDFVALPVKGVMGRGGRGFVAALAMLRAVARAMAVIRKTKPQVIIGFGGYAAFAGVLAGRLSGRPTAVHEQNSRPGMTNRLLGKVVDRVFLSMPDSGKAFRPRKCRLVGNPVRRGILELYERKLAGTDAPSHEAPREDPQEETTGKSWYGGVDAPSPFGDAAEKTQDSHTQSRETAAPLADSEPEAAPLAQMREESRPRGPRLLILGGSQGARALNEAVRAGLNAFLESGVEIWHQCGQTDYDGLRAAYREAGAEYVRLEPFINDMARAYAWADLVLCRAGASTLAEITAAGLPAVLVPFPYAAQDHQRHNARYLESRGAAVLLEQAEFYGPEGKVERLTDLVRSLLADKDRLEEMSLRSLARAMPYAARDLVDAIEALLEEKRR